MTLFESPTDQRANAQNHVVPHFTKGKAWQGQHLGVIERGEGCYVYDTDGNRYLDGLAGLFCTNLGHGRQDLAAAAAKQMEKLGFYPTWGWANPPAIEAASMIAEVAPADLSEVFFVSSGSEAVESALKFVRNYHVARGDDARYKVISREWCYHGTTLAALSVTGVPKFRNPFLPMLWDGTRHVRNTYGVVQELWDTEMGMYMHGSTFGGHPVATAVAVATMTALRDENILQRVLDNEGGFRDRMDGLMARHSCVKEVRGLGYFYALELMHDRDSGAELTDDQSAGLLGGHLAQFLREEGLLIRPDDRGATMLVVSPPLIADNTVLDDLADRLDRVLTKAGDWMQHNR